jgi:hypothetical protein
LNLKSSAIILELPGVNKKSDRPTKNIPIIPKVRTLLLSNECLNAWKPAPKIRKIPTKKV